jgi:uncharacterized protein with PIN domain
MGFDALKFIATQELGRLSRWLRMLGFDVSSYRGKTQGGLIVAALREERTILTRAHRVSEGLEKNTIVIASETVAEQLRQVVKITHINLDENKMFSRCALCNVGLVAVEKESVKDLLPPFVYTHQDCFVQCPTCHKLYWHGSHVNKIKATVSQIVKSA